MALLATVRAMGIDYLPHVRRETARFGDVLRNADPAPHVPSCPEWNADDLLWHMAGVLLFWGAIVRDRLADPAAAEKAEGTRPGDHAGLIALYDRAAGGLCDALAATPDDTAVWTWFTPEQNVGFISRRMTHEALIHRLDAELATGSVSDFDTDLAIDGVDEMLDHFFGDPSWAKFEPGGPIVRIRALDTDAEWLVQVGETSGTSPSGNTYEGEPAFQRLASGTPTVTVGASARDLDAWIWNRPTLAAPIIEGSDADYHAVVRVVDPNVN